MKKVFKIFIILLLIFSMNVNSFALLIPSNRVYEVKADEVKTEEIEVKKEPTIDDIILKNVKIGDIVTFGMFYDIADDVEVEKVPIKWKVLDRLGDSALLISTDILKTMPYNINWVPITWRDSTIREWLNHDFYDLAFTNLEKELINKVLTKNTGNIYTNVLENYVTRDDVFLLSVEEVHKYFGKDNSMIAVGTRYAKREGLWLSNNESSKGNSVWWLRSPGKNTSYASIVHAGGSIGSAGDGVATRGNGIRPCIWVKVK